MSEALIGPVCLLYLPITHRIQNVWVSHCGCLSTVCTHPSQTPGCLVGLSSAMVNLNYQFDWNEKHTDYFLSVCRGLSREDKLSQERPTWNVGSTIYEVWAQMGLKEMEEGWGLGILFCFWSTMMKTAGPITASWAQWTKVSGTRNQNKINPPHHKIFLPGIWSLQWQGMDNTENVLTN